MRKNKALKTFLIFSVFIGIFFIPSTISDVNAGPSIYYGPVTYSLSETTQEVPQIDIHVQNVYNNDTMANLTDSAYNYSYIIIDHSTDKQAKRGLLDYSISDDSFSETISLAAVPAGDYYFALNFSDDTDTYNNYTEFYKTAPFTIEHTIHMDYIVIPAEDDNSFSIELETFPTYTGYAALNDTNCQINYVVKKGNLQVKEGQLEYVSDNNFKVDDVGVRGLGTGYYYIYLELSCDYLSEDIDTETEKESPGHYFSRTKPLEDILTWIILVAIIVVVVILGALIYARRGAGRVEKRKTNQKEEVIEVIDINKTDATHLTTKKRKKKQKGKTEVSQDLIFSVPQWEEEDLEADASNLESGVEVEEELSTQYTMHCDQCDSWYEVDDLVKIDCPKCNISLNLAMYCPNEDKWFEVPGAGDYDCPKCGESLRFRK